MTERGHEEEPDLEVIHPKYDSSVATEGRSSIRWKRVAALATAVVVVGGLAYLSTEGGGNDKSSKLAKDRSAKAAPEPTTTTTIGPSLANIKPDYYGPVCSSETRTIKPGDTVFGLTTVGLKTDTYFLDQVFGWNLDYLKNQAKKDPALANPNDIAIGQKLKIETDCLEMWAVEPVRDWEHFKYDDTHPNAQPKVLYHERPVEFQFYPGTDGKTHNLVTVNYKSDPKGHPLAVESCEPSPKCYDYVAGAPSHPPKDNIYP